MHDDLMKACPGTCSDCVEKRKKPTDDKIVKAHPYVREGEEPLRK